VRVGFISDIHGNLLALDAVLADLAGRPADRLVCLGDAVQGGAQPAEVVARLRELACPVVMGNADAWLLTGEETGAEASPPSWMLAVRQWSLSRLSAEDRAFIAGFRPTVEVALPAGRTLLCCHGSPRSFDDVILPETPAEVVEELLGAFVPAILCGGHTHLQQIRQLGATFFFNPGSVGLPFRRDQPDDRPRVNPWAEYAVLTVEDDGWTGLEFRRVPYDVVRLIELIRAGGMPEPEHLVARYRPADAPEAPGS
jgi:predicted phosphodiesterase